MSTHHYHNVCFLWRNQKNISTLWLRKMPLYWELCPQCVLEQLCNLQIMFDISGIQAPPFDEGLVNNATAILANLCKQSRRAGRLST